MLRVFTKKDGFNHEETINSEYVIKFIQDGFQALQ